MAGETSNASKQAKPGSANWRACVLGGGGDEGRGADDDDDGDGDDNGDSGDDDAAAACLPACAIPDRTSVQPLSLVLLSLHRRRGPEI